MERHEVSVIWWWLESLDLARLKLPTLSASKMESLNQAHLLLEIIRHLVLGFAASLVNQNACDDRGNVGICQQECHNSTSVCLSPVKADQVESEANARTESSSLRQIITVDQRKAHGGE